MSKILNLLAWMAVAAGLVGSTILPEITNIATLSLMGVGLLILAAIPATRAVLAQPTVWVPLLAGLVLLVALLFTATTPIHVLVIFVLAPLWLVGPHAALLSRLKDRLTPELIARLALLGTAGAALVAGFDVLVLGADRGGFIVNNPIHLADIALMLGLITPIGLLDRGKHRYVYLLGPVLALATIWFSGSRGPLLAFVPMLICGAAALAWFTLPRRAALLSTIATIAVVGVAGFVVLGSPLAGRMGQFNEVVSLLSTGVVPEQFLDHERLTMLQSAWSAWLASPVYGHGMIDYTQIAASYGPADNPYPPSGHLHNDIADFAVIGGTLGLAAYGLLLLAPLIGAMRVHGPYRAAAIYLGLVTGIGYLAMGLTNAMFGILSQTVLYAVILALIAVLSVPGDKRNSA